MKIAPEKKMSCLSETKGHFEMPPGLRVLLQKAVNGWKKKTKLEV